MTPGRSWMCHEIIEKQVYRFVPQRERPVILDCGANIGLATLYWKQAHPLSRVIAFEPDPALFGTLAWNCDCWQLAGVELINRAVWSADGEMAFWAEGSTAGRLLRASRARTPPNTTVSTVRLRNYLE